MWVLSLPRGVFPVSIISIQNIALGKNLQSFPWET